MMRTKAIVAAILASTLTMPARAQDGHWGDSGAAPFNVPKGYSSTGEFNSVPDNAIRPAKKKKSTHNWRYDSDCPARTGRSMSGAGAEPEQEFARANPYCGDTPPTPLQQIPTIGSGFTVETMGAWNTSIVERAPRSLGQERVSLNGGLNLD
jgi:hypothetical protein